MLKILIADDEEPARTRMKTLLKDLPDVQILGEARNGEEVLTQCEKLDVNLVLLDIQMPGLTGLDTAEFLGDSGMLFIFVSAYSEHALEAFDLNACDYLTKPVRPKRLAQALDKARKTIEIRDGHQPSSLKGKISIPLGRKNVLIDEDQIVFATVYEGSMELWTLEKQYFLSWTLKNLEEAIHNRKSFFKSNRQTLINLNYLKAVEYSTSTLTMKNGKQLDLSRSAGKKLRELL
ncbi:MAG: hypothetical protein CSA81_06055 [Acidobacteria bacterium]|nr:MAG: hypothetical protein CSA81_06055 [Acidobacteriota bacterium]PIE89618.1 MAG: hypothetical protein CR997_10415 [Acidobacteriota bacterium]